MFKKVCLAKKLTIRDKSLFLFCENINNPSLPQLSKHIGFVWGKRGLKTAKKLRKKPAQSEVSYEHICTDNWDSFINEFKADNHLI